MVQVQTQDVSPTQLKQLRSLVKEDLGLSLGSNRKNALWLVLVIVILGAITMLVVLLLSTTNKPPKAPPYNPPSPPKPGAPGSIQWGAINPDMPNGCQNEPSPLGMNFTWGEPQVGASQFQPPYSEQIAITGQQRGGCGGSIGLNPGHLGSSASAALICPSGKLVTQTADADWNFTNFLGSPASVKVIPSEAHPGDHGWCFWSNQYVTDDYLKNFPIPTSGNSFQGIALPPALQPNQGPAVLEPGAQVKVSLSTDIGIATSTVGFMCSQFGVVKMEAREAYPPCQWKSVICALLAAYANLPWWAMPLMSMGMETMAAEDLEKFLATKLISAGKCLIKSEAEQAAEHYAECETGEIIARNAKTGAYKCLKSMEPGWSGVAKSAVGCLTSSGSKKKSKEQMEEELHALQKKALNAQSTASKAEKAYKKAENAENTTEKEIAAARTKWQKAKNAENKAMAAAAKGPSTTSSSSGGLKSQFLMNSQSLSQQVAAKLVNNITNCDKSLTDFVKCSAIIGIFIGDPCFTWSLGKKDSHCPTYWKKKEDIAFGHRSLDNSSQTKTKIDMLESPDQIEGTKIFSMPVDAMDVGVPMISAPEPLMYGSAWFVPVQQGKDAPSVQMWPLAPCKAPVVGVDTPNTTMNCKLVNNTSIALFIQVQVLSDNGETVITTSNNFSALAPKLSTNWNLSSQIGVTDVNAKSGVVMYSQNKGHWRFFISGASFLGNTARYLTTDFFKTWVSPPLTGDLCQDKVLLAVHVTSVWDRGSQSWMITVDKAKIQPTRGVC